MNNDVKKTIKAIDKLGTLIKNAGEVTREGNNFKVVIPMVNNTELKEDLTLKLNRRLCGLSCVVDLRANGQIIYSGSTLPLSEIRDALNHLLGKVENMHQWLESKRKEDNNEWLDGLLGLNEELSE